MSLSALAIRGAESTRVRDRSVGENSRNLLARGEIFWKLLHLKKIFGKLLNLAKFPKVVRYKKFFERFPRSGKISLFAADSAPLGIMDPLLKSKQLETNSILSINLISASLYFIIGYFNPTLHSLYHWQECWKTQQHDVSLEYQLLSEEIILRL